ncbi:hypothetical protein PFLuk1_04636 [Pseudomonas fluorescens]|nr:hypothetical protein PFLuk1_04636 [Pseudomonas fluorescens]
MAFDQAGGEWAAGPQLAGQFALRQLRLNLQWPQRLHVEGQFYAPEHLFRVFFILALGLVLVWRGLLALELDLQRHNVLQGAHGDLQLPGRLQAAIGGDAGLFQARQLMALQARDRPGGQA